ncbi:MAG: hypothetical protein AUI47_09165 [Acidobacteria bacterium 13_1_40CM_2_68_5]|nr:MAG: hypothetical protein AUI47_09165 [Acidobacteria bacterium 13_1_40CM_2_68_5]
MLELLVDEPIFVGFKAGRALRQLLESLGSAEKKYVSSEDSTFLRLCSIGEDLYVGKVIHEALATDRVDDIRRNILSILRKLGPAVPLPTTLRIFACRAVNESYSPSVDGVTSSPSAPALAAIRAFR